MEIVSLFRSRMCPFVKRKRERRENLEREKYGKVKGKIEREEMINMCLKRGRKFQNETVREMRGKIKVKLI